MNRPVAVLRPEPGNARTAAAAEALGLRVIRLPLFEVRPVAWSPPDPRDFDALVLTSANAVRFGGDGLRALQALPVYAVGAATAEAARQAGLEVVSVGERDGATLVADAARAGVSRALHLGGRERTLESGGPIRQAITVYASEPRAIAAEALATIEGAVALVHSAGAARRLDRIAGALDRGSVRIAALSAVAVASLGAGWGRIEAADAPNDDALLALARALAD